MRAPFKHYSFIYVFSDENNYQRFYSHNYVDCKTGSFLQVAPRSHERPFWPRAGGKDHKPWEKQRIAHIRLQSIRSPLPPQLSSSLSFSDLRGIYRERESEPWPTWPTLLGVELVVSCSILAVLSFWMNTDRHSGVYLCSSRRDKDTDGLKLGFGSLWLGNPKDNTLLTLFPGGPPQKTANR